MILRIVQRLCEVILFLFLDLIPRKSPPFLITTVFRLLDALKEVTAAFEINDAIHSFGC